MTVADSVCPGCLACDIRLKAFTGFATSAVSLTLIRCG